MSKKTPLYQRYATKSAAYREMGARTSAQKVAADFARQRALSRSAKGREILQRESSRLAVRREPFLRHMQAGLPPPRFTRDYGPTAPYAVVLKLRFRKDMLGQNGWTSRYRTDYVTLTYDRKPSPEKIQSDVSEIYEEHMWMDNGPMGDSDSDSDEVLATIDIVRFYVSTPKRKRGKR